jgi:hypothetical protein
MPLMPETPDIIGFPPFLGFEESVGFAGLFTARMAFCPGIDIVVRDFMGVLLRLCNSL